LLGLRTIPKLAKKKTLILKSVKSIPDLQIFSNGELGLKPSLLIVSNTQKTTSKPFSGTPSIELI